MFCKIADNNLFTNTLQRYFPLGEDMHRQLLSDLKTAKEFIFMEYFIVEEGIFWNSILEILEKKAAEGVGVRVICDDIGCMMTLLGNYDKVLKGFGIDAVPFSKRKGNADSEFNNRSHRKITVIDGRIGYTGGINIADEYINKKLMFGHWKVVGLRLMRAGVEICEYEPGFVHAKVYLSDDETAKAWMIAWFFQAVEFQNLRFYPKESCRLRSR